MATTKTRNLVIMRGLVEGNFRAHYFDDGQSVASFVLKTFSIRKTEAGVRSEPELTRCEVWSNASPSFGTDLEKGNFVAIEGYMRTTKYYDKKVKTWLYVTKVICTNLTLLCKKGK